MKVKLMISIMMMGCVLGTAAMATAQPTAKRLTEYGLKLGLNMASQSHEFFEEQSTADKSKRMGFVLGGFMIHNFRPNLAGQVELLYSMKGVKFSEEEYDEDEETTLESTLTYKLTYLEAPVLARFSLSSGGSVRPYLLGGPAIGLLLSAKGEVTEKVYGEEYDVEVDVKDEFKSMDIGLVLGGGVRLESGLLFELRYTHGLTNIDDTGIPGNATNRVISIMAGYVF